MKILFKLKLLNFLIFTFLVSSVALAQESPRENVSGTINGTSIKIGYGSPAVKGRKIGGEIAPYGQIWRTGANPVTEIEISQDVKIEGQVLHAGKYSIFTIPGENEWKVIFNSETGQWGIKDDGSANDDPSKDVLTVTVKPEKSSSFHERLTFVIDDKGFDLLWGDIAVPVAVK